MIAVMEAVYLGLGILLLALVYWDLFESIVVPPAKWLH